MTTSTATERRELAQRSSYGIEVTLFWTKPSDRLTIAVVDTRSDEALEFDVDGNAALDAFNHPYAYAPQATGAVTTAPSPSRARANTR